MHPPDYDEGIIPTGVAMANGVLLTDLYELTMLQAYHEQQMTGVAAFEFFVRKLPPQRRFLVAAGVAQVVDYLADLHFAADELAWLAACGRFRREFVDSLANLRFTGDVDAMPEGTVKSRLFYTLKKLAERLNEFDPRILQQTSSPKVR